MTDMSRFKVANAFKHLDPNKGLAGGVTAGFSSIRYKGKILALQHGGKLYPFKRDDDGSPLTYLDLIILGTNDVVSKVYYGEWNEDNASGPICASLKGDVPDPGVSIPQSKTCAICPHNEWITKPNGRRGKECQDHKRMAVLLMPSMTKKMLGTPLMEPVYLKIPPGSLRSLLKFSNELQHEGIPSAAVVTRVSFSQDQTFEFNFEVIQALTDKEAPRVLPMMDDAQTLAIINGGSVSGMRELPAPEKKAPERVETGLMEAFDEVDAPNSKPTPRQAAPQQTTPRGRGRPPKAAQAAAQIIDNEPAPQPPPQAADTAEPAGEPWEESDTDLDNAMLKLMGDKLNNMLK
jgi:hypothetical protein